MEEDETGNKNQVFLDMAWKNYEQCFNSMQHLDAKAYMIVTISALLITLNLSFVLESLSPMSACTKGLYVFEIALLVLAIVCAVGGLSSRKFREMFTDGFVDEQKNRRFNDMVDTLIVSLGNAQAYNEDLNDEKAHFIKNGLYILLFAIILSGLLNVIILFF